MGFLVRMDADRLLPSFAAFDRIQAEILARTEARAGNALQCFLRLEVPWASNGLQRMSYCRWVVCVFCLGDPSCPWLSSIISTHIFVYTHMIFVWWTGWLWPCFVNTKPFENYISMDFARIYHRPQQLSLPGLISRFFFSLSLFSKERKRRQPLTIKS